MRTRSVCGGIVREPEDIALAGLGRWGEVIVQRLFLKLISRYHDVNLIRLNVKPSLSAHIAISTYSTPSANKAMRAF
jgi:hypothetical protein